MMANMNKYILSAYDSESYIIRMKAQYLLYFSEVHLII